MHRFKKLFFTFVLTNLLALANSYAALDCSVVEQFGNLAASYVDDQISDQVVGMKQKLSKRKTLHIRDVQNVRFDGCTIKMKLKVKLARKIRKDAFGKIGVKATVKSFSRSRVCLKNAKVTSVNLSHTTGLGEAIYKMVANKVIPNNKCFRL